MKRTKQNFNVFIVIFLLCTLVTNAQQFDLLIKNGHVIDAKNGLDKMMDVAIKDGKIVKVETGIPVNGAMTVIDAKGLYVTPGLIDIHTHNFYGTQPDSYLSDGFSALPPDGFTFEHGVTTVVDAGGAGWRNFRLFKEQVIDRSKTRVLAFLNIVGSGMKGGAIEQNIADMDGRLTAIVAKRYPDLVVGVKLAHFMGHDWTPTDRAVEAGTLADIPVMIDFGAAEPELSLETLFMEKLRPGDIFTHMYGQTGGRGHVVKDGKVNDFVFKAQKRGIIFDVGHGGGSFVFEQAIISMQQGFKPNTISTDLHTGSMNGGMKDVVNVMSKFLNMGMSVEDVVERTTWASAKAIKRTDLGHLGVGAVADVAILNLRKGDFGFIDVARKKMKGNQKLECELTVREGKVVYDLNGLASPEWDK